MFGPKWYTTPKEFGGWMWAESYDALKKNFPRCQVTVIRKTAQTLNGIEGYIFDYTGREIK